MNDVAGPESMFAALAQVLAAFLFFAESPCSMTACNNLRADRWVLFRE
jgi:hypothetical protein